LISGEDYVPATYMHENILNVTETTQVRFILVDIDLESLP